MPTSADNTNSHDSDWHCPKCLVNIERRKSKSDPGMSAETAKMKNARQFKADRKETGNSNLASSKTAQSSPDPDVKTPQQQIKRIKTDANDKEVPVLK